MIEDLLTARQLQELLHVDRTTVYHMLSEGRLPGFKVGGQWRFSRRAIGAWLAEQQLANPSQPVAADSGAEGRPGPEVLPVNCVQPIQNVFAEALEVGAVTTALDGTPITAVSNSCAFCNLILATEQGRRRCRDSWQTLSRQAEHQPRLARCHAGLTYARGCIEVKHEFVAMIFAGQFRIGGSPLEDDKLADVAMACGIAAPDLKAAESSVGVLSDTQGSRVLRLLQVVASTFSEMGQERLALIDRLRRISEMSAV